MYNSNHQLTKHERTPKMNLKVIYDKYKNGDSLSNEEVEFGIEFFGDLADKLFACGDRFHFSAVEANTIHCTLAGYKQFQKLENAKIIF